MTFRTIGLGFAYLIAFVIGSAAVHAIQAAQTVPLQRRGLPEVVLTGCIVQGSTPTTFIFDNARKDPNNAVEKGERYALTSTIEDVDLRTHLNHEVRITGEVDLRVSAMPVPDRGGSATQRAADERTLPRLNAKSLTMVSNRCPSAR